MLSSAVKGTPFVKLPNEELYYASPPRITLSLKNVLLGRANDGEDAYALQNSSGRVYITNARIVYVPVTSLKVADFQSFSVQLGCVYNTYVKAPWFGPNVWHATVEREHRGGLPESARQLDLRMEFREGGAFDFHTIFERLKEAMHRHADAEGAAAPVPGRDLHAVHLEQLPAYDDPGVTIAHSLAAPAAPAAAHPPYHGPALSDRSSSPDSAQCPAAGRAAAARARPSEPPPGYDEAQRPSLGGGLHAGFGPKEAKW